VNQKRQVPTEPGEFERFDRLFRGVVSVSNKTVRERIAASKKSRRVKGAKKKRRP
jgi:hypothetical protein